MKIELIQSKIIEVRQQKVLIDRDLAAMYGVETRVLNQAVKRNIERFAGEDFMFQLTNEELKNWKSQIVISNEADKLSRSQIVILNEEENLKSQTVISSWGGARSKPYAFTELGVAMLSSVLSSKVAIEINRNIMRAFVMLRQFALNYAELNRKLDNFMTETNMQFSEVYQVLTELVEKKKIDEQPRRPVGFTIP